MIETPAAVIVSDELAAPLEPFYSDSNTEQLRKANQQVKDGQVVVKTMEELEAINISQTISNISKTNTAKKDVGFNP